MMLNGKTDIGRRRTTNQDSFVLRRYDETGHALGLVCDGMGGANGGNIASALACETFVRCVEEFLSGDKVRNKTATEGDYSSMLAHAVSDANQAVYRAADMDQTLKGMGTTLVAALVTKEVLYAVNVGDSRLYILSNGRLTQITKDHSLVQYLIDSGRMTPEEAKTFPNRNVITRAIGTELSVEADIFSVTLDGLGEDFCILLCSDGLSGYVAKDQIAAMLKQQVPYDGVRTEDALIAAANAAGGIDNITVVLMHSEPNTTAAPAAEKDGIHGTI